MKILSVIEFGSHARNDQDQYSDKDICIFVDHFERKEEVIDQVKKIINPLNINNCDFIIHDEEAFNFMLDRGSLFLWHLKLECTANYGSEYYNKKIKTLNTFDNYQYKLEHYLNLFYDLKEARHLLPEITYFDYSVMFTVIRNLSILVCYKINNPQFGRTNAFHLLIKEFPDIMFSKDDYSHLLEYKLSYERGHHLPKTKSVTFNSFISKTEDLIKQVKKILAIE